jgi:hypothetical protein
VNKLLDLRARLVFQRLQRFYQTFNIVATLVGGLSLAVLTFDELHGQETTLARAAEGLLCSSALTAVVAVTIATMLLFRFEGHETRPTRIDLLVAWVPLVLLDLVIVEFLVGLVLWYAVKNEPWRRAAMGVQLAVWLVFTIALAIWMWNTMCVEGGLGEEERTAAQEERRLADRDD